MTVTRLHTLYGVKIHETMLGGITAQNLPLGNQVQGEASSGEVYTRFQSLMGAKPQATFSTLNIAAALDLCGVTGYDVDSGDGVVLYAQKTADGATRTAGANHRSYTIADGLLVPQTLSVNHAGNATLSYLLLATSADGTTHPVAIAETVTLGAVTDGERFTLGPITIGAVTVAEPRSLSVQFGINARTEGAGSELYDTHAWIASIQPSLTITGVDVELLKAANIPLTGQAATHANTTIYLRKRAAGSTFVADATEEHIKLTADGLAVVEDAMAASGDDPAETGLVLSCEYDGTNAPITVDTSSALPA